MTEGQLPSSFDGDRDFYEENRWQKLFRRLKEEPLIPLGCGLTVWAFTGAARSIRRGDSHTANIMFRRRLYAQSFTLVAMVAGSMYYKPDRLRRREYEDRVAEEKAKEKRAAWIRELEARDHDEKEWKAKQNRAAAREKKASFSGIGGGKHPPEIGPVAEKMVQEKDQGIASGSDEGLVVKAVRELKDTAKESAESVEARIVSTEESVEAVKENIGPTRDAKETKRER